MKDFTRCMHILPFPIEFQIKIILVMAFLVFIFGTCSMEESKPQEGSPIRTSLEEQSLPEYIGVAVMKEDSTIVLYLRAEGPEGIVGHGQVEYKPDDEDYGDILKHLNGLEIGETKSVPPFPDGRSSEK